MADDSKRLAEAALFMSPEALTLNELTKIMDLPSFSLSLKALDDLEEDYKNQSTALMITKDAKGRYQMTVKPEYSSKVSHLAVSTDMTKATLRTLGLVAVKQPVRQSLIVAIIGNKAYDYIKELEERGFLRSKRAGTTKLLSTTPKFESYFGGQIDKIKGLSGTGYQSMLKAEDA
ncbi:MAG: SMC-Scp complex subunit ScpB [Candidatus Micrarchaeota archaeon]